MTKKDLTNAFKKFFTSRGGDALKMEITPYRDWRVVVVVFFLGLTTSLGFNVYMSIEINRDNFFTAESKNGGEVVLNKKGLEKILADLEEKNTVFKKVSTEGLHMVDPSL